MEVGQTVYTVNNKTGDVDSWEYDGAFPIKGELLLRLINGKNQCYLPARCVFKCKSEAKRVAELHR